MLQNNSARYPLPADFQVGLAALKPCFAGLQSPECIVSNAAGEFLMSDRRGGFTHVDPGGKAQLVQGRTVQGGALHANGIALGADGRVLVAHLGDAEGGVYRLGSTGSAMPVVTTLEGRVLPPTNFVLEDANGTVWFTVSTRHIPRMQAWYPDVAEGYIAVHDARGTRILADGLGYTNEIAFSPDGLFVYVNETHARRLTRFRLRPGPTLTDRETVCSFPAGDQPDGVCFDAFGGAWVTCIVSNKVYVVRPDGMLQLVLADTDARHVARYVSDLDARRLCRDSIWTCGTSSLGNVSSLCFAGPQRRTVLLGSLLGHRVLAFECPVPGHPPVHWHRRFAGGASNGP
ncbi:SMP-30/gluconolactonase/LRE family protein [Pseudorhodoferax soli]|uniref:Sugar lactone lactonase YvrE n=1 Tax=Pseudorhodoferax soli TaxID=545864 RepID=A0A368XN48_9BURK|nr:SMP-30/gluconolactonase/LRE family protein [Pseudorhodoferax soli]RCW69400.1 sugar lactone lactonase YvrE [Pseudorhodoferax soli]